MDKITGKTSFGQWFSSINLQLFEENVKMLTYQETVRFVARLILIKGAFCMHRKINRKLKLEMFLANVNVSQDSYIVGKV